MEIIKQCTLSHALLRTNTYASTLAHFDQLFESAKRDFPTLERTSVNVVIYGGDTHRGMYGIEFPLPDGATPSEDYQRIAEMPLLK